MTGKKRRQKIGVFLKKILYWLLLKIKRFWGSAVLALFFLFCSYVFSNLDLAIVGDNDVLKWIKIAQYAFFKDDEVSEMPDSVLFVNTCFDNTLIESYDSYGRPSGTQRITNRRSLHTLLRWLQIHDNYKYIMMDVGLTTVDKTEYDDSLYSIIERMPRFAMAKLDTLPIDSRIKDKCFDSSYRISVINSDCVKIPLFSEGRETLPYKVFSDITRRTISHIGPFYFEGGHLARRAIYPNYSLIIRNQFSHGENVDDEKFYNIEKGILEGYSLDLAKYLFENKIIVIGDFADKDMHQTYAGTLAGPVIQYNVITSLMNDSHKIPYYLLFLLYVIFFLISDNLLHKRILTVDETRDSFGFSNLASRKLIPLALLSTYYSLLLILLCALIYLLTGQAYDILFTGIIIGLTHWIIRIIKK